jgi:hypothetical protein
VAPVSGGEGIVEIAAEKDSIGKLILGGAGSTLQGGDLAVGGTAKEQGGSGSLTIGAQTTAVFSTATVWKSGKIADAGSLTINRAVAGDGILTLTDGAKLRFVGSYKLGNFHFVRNAQGTDITHQAAPSDTFVAFGAAGAGHPAVHAPSVSAPQRLAFDMPDGAVVASGTQPSHPGLFHHGAAH